MNLTKILFLNVIIFIFIISCSEVSDESNVNLKVEISPSEKTISIDENATFSVNIKNSKDLFAISAKIIFDSTKIYLVNNSIIIGDIWNGDASYEIIYETGCLNICVGLYQTYNNDFVDGDGTLFCFTLNGISNGHSDIIIENIELIDENGDYILGYDELEIQNGLLSIVE